MKRMTLALQDQGNQVTESLERVVQGERGLGGWQGQCLWKVKTTGGA